MANKKCITDKASMQCQKVHTRIVRKKKRIFDEQKNNKLVSLYYTENVSVATGQIRPLRRIPQQKKNRF
jgi:hypothetical protein